ncbi:MAG TPA: pyridoxamine 5'-phosphate oxidase [Longimicrobiales bacterium]|nr:pyridoxamine 5'-phosphate oxidase [Longimicrobiales bacterium]
MTGIREHLKALVTLGKGAVQGMNDPTGTENPIDLVEAWYETAQECGMFMPEAMTLATSTPDGAPSARMVLLKGIDDRGFRFFTNYESRKADELEANPRVALILHWAVIERQIRIEGSVERLTKLESYEYFSSRPRGSRIGAWASEQSRPLESREAFEAQVDRYEKKFEGEDIPLPPHWGGYRVVPTRIEFWQGRASRLHDRWVFRRDAEGELWELDRLQP